jgi:hypothetical protein
MFEEVGRAEGRKGKERKKERKTYRKPRLNTPARVNLSLALICKFHRMTYGNTEQDKSVTIDDTVV